MNRNETITISLDENRFDRFRLIPWWDQARLADTRALVLGAGALGNEIIKNLALLGVGYVCVVDFDRVENSNLSRSVLFTSADEGRRKSEAAADAARRIYPDMNVVALHRDIIFDLGWGWYLDSDVVLTGLDGREARLAANRACAFTRKTFVDGAIEGIDGVARTFMAWNGPCYECTMSQKDWELVHNRRSCNLLSREEMQTGHVPTTPTIGSAIASLQVQQALKFLHGLDCQPGRGLYLNGLTFESHAIEYQRDDGCFAHEHATEIVRRPWRAGTTLVRQSLSEAEKVLGGRAVLELRNDIVVARNCRCGFGDAPYSPLLRLDRGAGVCPHCKAEMRMDSLHSLDLDQLDGDRTLSDVGIAEYDVARFRRGTKYWDVLLDGDRPTLWPRESAAPWVESKL